ncbi:MAG: hypothetical protein H0T60_17565 [Acidobacteria bacterium]|nr:hypothetical protein [Acidobacteriota bacterium]
MDKEGNMIEFMLSAKLDVSAAKRFLQEMDCCFQGVGS